MAYSSRGRSYRSRSRAPKRSRNTSYKPRRGAKRSTKRTSSKPQIIKIVVQQEAPSVANPMAALQMAKGSDGRAKF